MTYQTQVEHGSCCPRNIDSQFVVKDSLSPVLNSAVTGQDWQDHYENYLGLESMTITGYNILSWTHHSNFQPLFFPPFQGPICSWQIWDDPKSRSHCAIGLTGWQAPSYGIISSDVEWPCNFRSHVWRFILILCGTHSHTYLPFLKSHISHCKTWQSMDINGIEKHTDSQKANCHSSFLAVFILDSRKAFVNLCHIAILAFFRA